MLTALLLLPTLLIDLVQVLASATRLKSFNESFRDEDENSDNNTDDDNGNYDDDGFVQDDAGGGGAWNSMFDSTLKSAGSRPSSSSSTRPQSSQLFNIHSLSAARTLPTLRPASALAGVGVRPASALAGMGVRPASALAGVGGTGNALSQKKAGSRGSRPGSAVALGVKDGGKSMEDEAMEVEELQTMVRLMKQQQHGSRENMLAKQQQQQQQRPQEQQSSAERAVLEYRSAMHLPHDPKQLNALLEVRTRVARSALP